MASPPDQATRNFWRAMRKSRALAGCRHCDSLRLPAEGAPGDLSDVLKILQPRIVPSQVRASRLRSWRIEDIAPHVRSRVHEADRSVSPAARRVAVGSAHKRIKSAAEIAASLRLSAKRSRHTMKWRAHAATLPATRDRTAACQVFRSSRYRQGYRSLATYSTSNSSDRDPLRLNSKNRRWLVFQCRTPGE